MRSHQEGVEERFLPRILPSYLALTIPVSGFIIALIVYEGWPGITWYGVAGMLAVVFILPLLSTWSGITLFTVYVCPEGIRCLKYLGKYDFVEWHEIKEVVFLNLLLLRWLHFQKDLRGSRMWIQLDLVNAERFRDLVTTYAGRTHPLTKALWQHGG